MRTSGWLLAALPLLGMARASRTDEKNMLRLEVTAPRPPVALADTGQFPLRYCTALPRLDITRWDADYATYYRFLTPEIRRTQLGLRTTSKGVSYWCIAPAATAHAQLDTLTRLANPAQVQGRWRSILIRVIEYRDSASVAEKHIYRSVRLLRTQPEAAELTLTDGRMVLVGSDKPDGPPHQHNRRYDIVSGRYLLAYGLSRSSGGVSQVGLDAQGHLLLHSIAVCERKIPGQYLTYVTVLTQTIFERQS